MGSSQSKTSEEEYEVLFKHFKAHYHSHRDRLFSIISELKRVSESFSDINQKEQTGKTAATVTGVTGLALGLLAAPFTGGVSLALAGVGAAAGVSAAATEIGVKVTHSTETEEANRLLKSLTDGFVSKIQSVMEKVDQVECSIEKMRQNKSKLYKKKNLFKLQQSITSLRSNITSACRSKSFQEFEEVLNELDKLCGQIDFMS